MKQNIFSSIFVVPNINQMTNTTKNQAYISDKNLKLAQIADTYIILT